MIKSFYEFVKESKTDRELLDLMKQLSDQTKRLKSLVKADFRDKFSIESYEDYFLEFKELEKFLVRIHKGGQIGLTTIDMWGLIDEDKIESEFYRLLNKSKSIKTRLTKLYNFECHFDIKLNGKSQSKPNPDPKLQYNRQENVYEFCGLGTSLYGYDNKGIFLGNGGIPFPSGKVAMKIEFFLV